MWIKSLTYPLYNFSKSSYILLCILYIDKLRYLWYDIDTLKEGNTKQNKGGVESATAQAVPRKPE